MAFNRGRFGNGHRRQNHSNTNNQVRHLRLRNYEGPYDHSSLTRARDELTYFIEQRQDTAHWYRIQRKTHVNIYSFKDSDDGFGAASTAFSHAGLPENQPEQETLEDQFSADSHINLSENYSAFAKGASATASIDRSVGESIDVNTSNNEIDMFSADSNVTVNANKPIRNYSLEVDGIAILPDTTNTNEEIVIEDDSSHKSLRLKSDTQMDNTENPDIERNGDNNVNSEVKRVETTGTLALKCDVCDYVTDSKPRMQEHLYKSIHFAASEYISDEPNKMKLKHSMVVMNAKAKYKTILVVCPDSSCLKIFPHIHECVGHFNLQHVRNKNERNKYGLVSVVREEDCINAVNPKQCYVCFKQFDNRTHLNAHLKDMGHYPYTEMKNCRKIFFCFYCKSSFDKFENITSHQEIAHTRVMHNGALQFTVFHYQNIKTNTLFLGDGITLPPSSGITSVTGSKVGPGTMKEIAGTRKRKLDGSSEALEPRVKVKVNDENTSRDRDMNKNSLHVYDTNNVTDKTSFCGTSELSNDTGNSKKKHDSLEEMYKCDYCMKIARDENQMYLHLVQHVHSSASTVLIDPQGNIAYLKQSRTVEFQSANYKKVVATCPEANCRLLFDSVFICDDHNTRCHKNLDRSYHLADIVDRVIVKVGASQNICATCGQSFGKNKQLHSHYTEAGHFPLKDRDDCNIYTLCIYCNKTFLSFKSASGHVKTHQKFAQNGLLVLIILYVSKNARKCSLPPYQLTKDGELASIRSKISNLQDFKKTCGQLVRSEIQEEIRDLKQLL